MYNELVHVQELVHGYGPVSNQLQTISKVPGCIFCRTVCLWDYTVG